MDRPGALQNTGVGVWRSEHLINDYSGRGMGRERCFGLIGDDRLWAKFLASLTELEMLARPDDEEAKWSNLLADIVNSDSMGHDKIFYFPGVSLFSES